MNARLPGLALLLLLAWPAAAATRLPATVRLATWNLEWLMTPETTLQIRVRCQQGQARQLPCDVAQGRPRSEADYRALAREARKLDADVIALQEVEGEKAARRVFPGYEFCMTGRRDLQNVGFAVRRGVPFRCEPDLAELSLGDRVRRGAQITLFPGTRAEMRLLSVHLKAGCNRDPLEGRRRDCGLLAQQAPVLGRWIDEQVAAGRAYAVLGDFNRDLRREKVPGLKTHLTDDSPRPEELVDAGEGAPFVACHAGQRFTGYIDYILLGGPLGRWQVQGSFRRHVYRDVDAQRYRLSDHCPLSVSVRLRAGNDSG